MHKTLKDSSGICLNSSNKAVPSDLCRAHIQRVTLNSCHYTNAGTALSCSETKSCTLPGLGSCAAGWRPPAPDPNLWTHRPGISQRLLDISISRAAFDSLWPKDGLGNTQMSHIPFKKSSVTEHTAFGKQMFTCCSQIFSFCVCFC